MVRSELAKRQHFLMELEQAIQVANREVIGPRIPAMTKENILPFAVSVAQLRARYLEAAFALVERHRGDVLEDADIETLRRYREAYVEAREAFEALRHAIERGYVDLGE